MRNGTSSNTTVSTDLGKNVTMYLDTRGQKIEIGLTTIVITNRLPEWYGRVVLRFKKSNCTPHGGYGGNYGHKA